MKRRLNQKLQQQLDAARQERLDYHPFAHLRGRDDEDAMQEIHETASFLEEIEDHDG